MIKQLLLSVLLCFALYAQSPEFGFGVGGGISYPTGEFKEGVNFGYSPNVTLHVPVFGVHTILSLSYGLWDEKNVEDTANSVFTTIEYTNFPVLFVGARKYFGSFFVSALAGIYPVKLKVKEVRNGEPFEYEDETTQGSLAPGFGVVFPFQGLRLEPLVEYMWNENFSQAGLRLNVLF